MTRNPRGITLIEVLLTCLLFSVALGLLAGFVGRVSDVMRFSSGKDRTVQAARLALDRMQDELSGALQLLEPASTPSDKLQLVRLNPRVTGRLPNPLPSTLPASWDPVDPAFLIQVTYALVDDQLQRTVLHNDGSTRAEVLLDQVQGLQTERLTPASVRLTLLVWDSRRTTRWIALGGIRLR